MTLRFLGVIIVMCAACGHHKDSVTAGRPATSVSGNLEAAQLLVRIKWLHKPQAEASQNLIVGWYSADDESDWGKGLSYVARHIASVRVVAVDPVSLSQSVLIDVPANQEVIPWAVLDRDREYWPSHFRPTKAAAALFGKGSPVTHPGGKLLRAKIEIGNVTTSAQDRTRLCDQAWMTPVELEAPEVRGAPRWENETKQEVCVILPPTYHTHPNRHYPTVYLLPALFGDHMSELENPGVRSIVQESGHEVILVGVDGRTATGSSYFIDGPINGQWLQYLADRVVDAVDSRFRTLRSSKARGLVGHSTGGYNALTVAMRRPEIFGAALASAPDGLDLEAWLFPDGKTMHKDMLAWMRFEALLGASGQMTSYAAAFSLPPKDETTGLQWPVDLDTGHIREPTWSNWQGHNPYRWLDDDTMVKRMKSRLSGRLFIEAAPDDEFGVGPPARRFSQKLNHLGIDHYFRYEPGGHFDRYKRYRRALPLMLGVLTQAQDAKPE